MMAERWYHFSCRGYISDSIAVVLSISVAMLFVGSTAAIESKSVRSLAQNVKERSPEAKARLDREIETEALVLVDEHLPQLKRVLKRLRSDQPREYEKAIRDLARSARKLELAKKRDARFYDIEVESLQAQNEVNLLTARLKVRDSDSDRKRLRKAAFRLQKSQLTRYAYDIEVFRQRLERTQQQLDTAIERLKSKKQNTDSQLDKSYLRLLRKAGRGTLKKKNVDESVTPLPLEAAGREPNATYFGYYGVRWPGIAFFPLDSRGGNDARSYDQNER